MKTALDGVFEIHLSFRTSHGKIKAQSFNGLDHRHSASQRTTFLSLSLHAGMSEP